jgi:hypothetical protein
MNYLAIGLVIIIFIILYNLYYYLTNNALTSGLQPLNRQITKTYDELKDPNALSYSYQCWLYINTTAESTQRLFYRGGLSGSNNTFEVLLDGQTLKLKAGTGASRSIDIMTITSNFPIQKWTYLVINVTNCQTFEAYINGKLAKTVNVSDRRSTTPTSRTQSLYIGNQYLVGSYVTKFLREPKTFDAKTVWDNYLYGNGLTDYFKSLLPYGLNMTISKGEELQRVIKFF